MLEEVIETIVELMMWKGIKDDTCIRKVVKVAEKYFETNNFLDVMAPIMHEIVYTGTPESINKCAEKYL